MVRKVLGLSVKQLSILRFLSRVGAPVSITAVPGTSGYASHTLVTLAARGFIRVTIELLPKGKAKTVENP